MNAPCVCFTGLSASRARLKKARGLCCEKYCSRRAKPDRRRCSRCNQRRWRESHPIEAAFDNLRTHARQRGVSFWLTLSEFREFCERTRYHELSGKRPEALTVDRIDSRFGYSADNIQVLTHEENSTKRDEVPAECLRTALSGWEAS